MSARDDYPMYDGDSYEPAMDEIDRLRALVERRPIGYRVTLGGDSRHSFVYAPEDVVVVYACPAVSIPTVSTSG